MITEKNTILKLTSGKLSKKLSKEQNVCSLQVQRAM